MLFTETQRFTQWWLWVILVGLNVFPIVGILNYTIRGPDFNAAPGKTLTLVVVLICTGLLTYFLRTIRLRTEIDRRNISIDFWPLASRRIPWGEVDEAVVLDYGFVGGWGLRFSPKYGTVYNVKGSKGLAIRLKNGQRVCIGTQKPSELSQVVRNIRGSEI